jgi:hypothetical protein
LNTPSNKRQFTRIGINLAGQLTYNHKTWPVVINDVSIHGFSIRVDKAAVEQVDTIFILTIKISDINPPITANVRLKHVSTRMDAPAEVEVSAGMELVTISVESMAELRRLILLNSDRENQDQQDIIALLDTMFHFD